MTTDTASAPPPAIDGKMLERLVCPITKETLRYDAARGELISEKAKRAYPIRDGVPIMLESMARKWDKNEAPHDKSR